MKDAYYFSHDSNAKDDPKCVLLIEQLGMEGYGIYWMLVETLRDQPNYKYPVILIPALARRYNTTAEKVKTVVFNYSLFVIENDEFFFTDSLIRRMEKLEDKREKARNAGIASAKARLNPKPTNVEHPLNDCSTSKVNKSIVNENKENESKENEFFFKFADIEKMKGTRQYIENCQQIFNISESEVKNNLDKFWLEKQHTGELERSQNEVFGHFKNWLKKQQNGNNKGFNSRSESDWDAKVAEADAIIERAFRKR